MSLNSMKSKLPFEDKVVNQDTKMERESMIKMYQDIKSDFPGISSMIQFNPCDNLDNL